jgi:hypothetical protein
MRHNPNSAVYNGAYINERVKFDVQSAFLERPSAHGLLRALTHMSLTRDPRAPVNPPEEVLQALPPDPEIRRLEQQREELKAGSHRVIGTQVEEEVRRLTTMINSARIKWRNAISEEYRAEYFRRRPTEDIEKQSEGLMEEEYVEPLVLHQIPERAKLAEVMCGFPKDLTLQDILTRRIYTVDLMMALCCKREIPRRYQRRVRLPRQPLVKQESPEAEPFPLVCEKSQCPFCIGDELKTYKERTSSFCRPSKMMDHVERAHLRHIPADQKISCRHPVCKSNNLILTNLMHFKNHVATVHGISLRA